MKRLLFLVLALCGAAFGQNLAGINGDCQLGGEQTLTSNNPSTATRQIGTTTVNKGAGVQASFPQCQVGVFITGTSNKAVIYSDTTVPTLLANPFTANTDGSWTFFTGAACYDIVMSTGNGPVMPYPRTLTDVCLGGAASGTGIGGSGTPPHLGVWATPLSLGNSTITDDGVNPPQSPNGMNFASGAGFVAIANCNPSGTVLNHLVANSAGCATLNASTTNVLGIAGVGSGNVGIVQVATNFTYPCVFDNQTTDGDWVVAGTPLDECHDAGASRPTNGVQIIGHVHGANSGIGTISSVIQNTGDTNSAGTASGIVSNCATPGALAFYSVTGTTIICDPSFITDGAGDFSAVSGTFTGSGAGVIGFKQGTAPSTPLANTAYWYAPTSISSTFGTSVPGAAPATTGCLQGTTSGGNVTMSWTGAGCGSGSGSVTSVATTTPISGGTITTTGTISCPTCAIGPGSSTTNHLAKFSGTDGITLADGGAIPTGTVTSVATTSPIGGGTITSTGTLTCTTCVVASSPGAGVAHFAGSTQTVTSSAVVGADMTNNTVTATQLATQYSKGSCTEVWGGSGGSFAMQSGDDAVVNNGCYNDSGVTRTITALKCRSDNAANTTVLTPTFGSAGTGTAILTGTLTCGNSYAYSATGTLNNTAWTTGTGIDPGMSTVGNATSIAMIVEYTY